jgi:transcriptional regulator with XRE-family HTH domain
VLANPGRLRKIFAFNLRATRKRRLLSQEGLSIRAGLNHAYVGSIERGERNISIENIEKLAAALKVDPRVLLNPPESYLLRRFDKLGGNSKSH